MYLNKAIIYGNLTRDPEMRSLPSGIAVATFSVATNRVYKDKEGRKQESTDYHNVVVFGRQAEVIGQYLKKGSGIFVEGRMQTRSWEQNGEKKYRTEIVADRFQFGPKSAGSTGGGSYNQDKGSGDQMNQDVPVVGGDEIDYPENEINPEDIPF